MDRRAIGSSLLALAFGPVALGAIALGAATTSTVDQPSIAASPESHHDGPRLAARNDAAADDVRESAGERVVAAIGPAAPFDGRGAHAPVIVDTRCQRALADAALILSFAPKTSPPV